MHYRIIFDSPNGSLFALARQMATTFNTPIENNIVKIPSEFGKGYIQYYTLHHTIEVLIINAGFNHAIEINYQNFKDRFTLICADTLIQEDITSDNFSQSSGIVLLNENKKWSYNFEKNQSKKTIIVSISYSLLTELLSKQTADDFLEHYFSKNPSQFFKTPIDKDFRFILNSLSRSHLHLPFKHVFIYNRILILLETFINRNFKTALEQTRLTPEETARLIKAEAMLVKDFSEAPPTIETLAKLCGISATKLKKDFKTLYGFAIYEYYQKSRMMQARMILQSGENSIKETGMMVGYSNLSHFAAAFKKEFGILPSELSAEDEALEIQQSPK